MLIRKITALLLACALTAALLCSCGGNDTRVVTLRTMSTLGDVAEYNIYREIVSGLSADYPDVYLRDTTVAAADAFRLDAGDEATYKASDAPHVVYAARGSLEAVSSHLVPLSEIKQDYPDFASGISTAALESVRSADGEIYCIPMLGEWSVIVINRAVFDRFSVPTPYDWNSLLNAVFCLSEQGVIPFANSADSCPQLIEQLVSAYGGAEAVRLGLDGYSNIIEQSWLPALGDFAQLCRSGAFAPAAMTEAVETALALVSATDLPEAYDAVLGYDRDSSMHADACELFNSGLVAMIVLDSTAFDDINYTEDCSVIGFPSPVGYGMGASGGFRSGFAITRRAYDDPGLRDVAVEFVSRMTGAQTQADFAALGYLPSDGSALSGGLVGGVFAVGGELTPSTRSGAALSAWSDIGRLAGQLYYGILTPETMCAQLADPELIWSLPEPETEPEIIVSGTDIPDID